MVHMINQIIYCRVKVSEELVKIKIKDRADVTGFMTNELKKKLFNIKEIRNRELVSLIDLVHRKNKTTDSLRDYNDPAIFKNHILSNA